MASTAVLVLKIVSDVSGAKAGLAETETTVGRAQKSLGGMVVPATVALGAVTAFGLGAADAASNTEQAMGAVESVFKDNADTVKAWSASSSKDVGLAQADYLTMAAKVGSQLKGMGVPLEQVGGQTNDLIKLSSDLAATYGGTTAEAIDAVSALLRGERDPIERYGVSLKQVDINAALAADGITEAGKATAETAKAQAQAASAATAVERAQLGVMTAQKSLTEALKGGDAATIKIAQSRLELAKSGLASAQAHQAEADAAVTAATNLTGLDSEALKAATAQAFLALLTKQTADAQGAFSRESDTAAHAQQVAGAAMTDTAAALGVALLPAVVAVSDGLTALSGFITENKDLVLALAAVVAILAGGILAANIALKAFTLAQNAIKVATAAWTAVQWLLNAALAANPIGLVVLAILALIAVIVLAWNKSETFRRIVTAVFNAVLSVIKSVVDWIVAAFGKLGEVLAGPFKVMESVARAVAGVIKSIMDGIKRAIQSVMDFIGAIGRKIQKFVDDLPDLPFGLGKAAPPVPPTAPALRAGRAASVPTGGGGSSFGVTLVLDREVFGRATVGSIRRYDRRNGAAQLLPTWS